MIAVNPGAKWKQKDTNNVNEDMTRYFWLNLLGYPNGANQMPANCGFIWFLNCVHG